MQRSSSAAFASVAATPAGRSSCSSAAGTRAAASAPDCSAGRSASYDSTSLLGSQQRRWDRRRCRRCWPRCRALSARFQEVPAFPFRRRPSSPRLRSTASTTDRVPNHIYRPVHRKPTPASTRERARTRKGRGTDAGGRRNGFRVPARPTTASPSSPSIWPPPAPDPPASDAGRLRSTAGEGQRRRAWVQVSIANAMQGALEHAIRIGLWYLEAERASSSSSKSYIHKYIDERPIEQ